MSSETNGGGLPLAQALHHPPYEDPDQVNHRPFEFPKHARPRGPNQHRQNVLATERKKTHSRVRREAFTATVHPSKQPRLSTIPKASKEDSEMDTTEPQTFNTQAYPEPAQPPINPPPAPRQGKPSRIRFASKARGTHPLDIAIPPHTQGLPRRTRSAKHPVQPGQPTCGLLAPENWKSGMLFLPAPYPSTPLQNSSSKF
ncbi:hypothetical protein H257_16114 [Aphanomyces astaci]|uniref:Uncharacterized protein n=1 Tax=Aphanomyces astaci TaxID=112090 RepID=W4FJU1_APHAT|nr:hypothetical protein H257_16114 [Aphanomyces astaci]ETV67755.1 hypothetical protein H257_16114 [Aphanomyces astaci]|eukprot:XP_009842748.1 hypothetical protein H257_16114 [Aphanomyces astaci]